MPNPTQPIRRPARTALDNSRATGRWDPMPTCPPYSPSIDGLVVMQSLLLVAVSSIPTPSDGLSSAAKPLVCSFNSTRIARVVYKTSQQISQPSSQMQQHSSVAHKPFRQPPPPLDF